MRCSVELPAGTTLLRPARTLPEPMDVGIRGQLLAEGTKAYCEDFASSCGRREGVASGSIKVLPIVKTYSREAEFPS